MIDIDERRGFEERLDKLRGKYEGLQMPEDSKEVKEVQDGFLELMKRIEGSRSYMEYARKIVKIGEIYQDQVAHKRMIEVEVQKKINGVVKGVEDKNAKMVERIKNEFMKKIKSLENKNKELWKQVNKLEDEKEEMNEKIRNYGIIK